MTKGDRRNKESREDYLRLSRSSGIPLAIVTAVLLAVAVALHVGIVHADTTAWPAEMTVGVDDKVPPDLIGYFNVPEFLDDRYWAGMGSLDHPTRTHDGIDCTVVGIYYPDFSDYEGVSPVLFPHVEQLLLEGLVFKAGDSR